MVAGSVRAQDLPIPGTADRWTLVAIEFVQALDDGDFDGAAGAVAPALADGPMSAGQLETLWGQVQTQLGPLVEIQPHRLREEGEHRLVELSARFERQSVTLLVPLDGDGRVVGLQLLPAADVAYAVPAYADTLAFTEREVTVGDEGWELGATLSLPRGDGPFPAVALVHGSGPNDRDETIGPNRPFRDLAWGLASNGIAVLRYDKRTRAHGHRMDPLDMTLADEVVDDALAALALLRDVEGVDPHRVFVLGHSLGATLAPLIAERDGAVAGAILLAGMARPLASTVREQIEYLAGYQATTDEARDQVREILAQLDRFEEGALPDTARVLGMPVRYIRELDDVGAVDVAARLGAPMLVLQGERDYQVTLADFRIWQDALAGRDDVTFQSYPALDHLFMAGEGPSTPEQYMAEQRKVAEAVIRDVAEWIARTGLAVP